MFFHVPWKYGIQANLKVWRMVLSIYAYCMTVVHQTEFDLHDVCLQNLSY